MRPRLLSLAGLATFALAAAVVVAVVAGTLAAAERDARPAPSPQSDLIVVSRHAGGGETVVAGALASSPRWGVALVTPAPALNRPPTLLVTPTPNGPLRIVRAGGRSYLLRSARGWLYELELQGEDADPTLYAFGARLDPAHLPALGRRGIAIPVLRGDGSGRSVVLLVGVDKWLTPHLYGFLAGFALPSPTTPAERLERPLVGPDGGLYRIDPSARRLVRIAPAGSARAWRPEGLPPRGCTSWPAGAAGSYRACPNGITLVSPTGRERTIEREPACRPSCVDRNWESVLPSPDARTLLVQQGLYACGGQWTTYFVPAGGGSPARTIPQFDFSSSWSLGWIDDDRALITADGVAECGTPRSGIYVVDRRLPGVPPQAVALAPSHDATLWSAGGVRTRTAARSAASSAAPAG